MSAILLELTGEVDTVTCDVCQTFQEIPYLLDKKLSKKEIQEFGKESKEHLILTFAMEHAKTCNAKAEHIIRKQIKPGGAINKNLFGKQFENGF